MKTTIFRKALAALLLLCAAGTLHAQELIRGAIDYLLCDTSIIRTIGEDSVLIYNKNNTSTFMIVRPGLDPVPTRYLDSIFVNDFEVVGKEMYFCGYKFDGERKKGVFGSFPLSRFNSNDTTLKYYELDTCTELRKLEFYSYGDMLYYEGHLVMTGTTGTRSDVLVHKIVYATVPEPPMPPSPLSVCDIYFSQNKEESFDDVAVTKDYVVVSTRNTVEGIPIVDFWHFDRPTMTLMPLLSSNIHHLRSGSPFAETPVFLEHTEGNDYAAVFKNGVFSRMDVLLLTAPNNINSCVEIFGDETETIIPIEIKYNTRSSVTDILARSIYYRDNLEYQFVPMQIYHVTPAVINNSVPFGNVTKYPDRFLWSLDPAKSSYCFFASGGEGLLPNLFKYRHDQWERCPERFFYRFEVGSPKGKLEDKRVEFEWIEPNSPITKTRLHEIPFPVQCQAGKNE